MRLVDWVRIIGMVAALLVAPVMVARRRLIERLKADGAVTPDTASPAPGRWLAVRAVRALARSGAVGITADGRVYLHEEREAALARKRNRRALIFIAGLFVLALLFWFTPR